jgi:hypothetical protein
MMVRGAGAIDGPLLGSARASRASLARAALTLTLALALADAGCASRGSQSPPSSGAPPAAQPPVASGPTGPTAADRVDAGLYGFLVGATLGAFFGPIGAGAGAVSLALYGALTGRAPLGTGGYGVGYPRGGYPGGGYPGGGYPGPYPPAEAQREAELESQLEQQVAKGDALEQEIEAELRRQEELLRQIEREEAAGAALEREAERAPSASDLAARVDPRAAPTAPAERDLPVAIFDEDRRKIPKGQWENERELTVTRLSLDADRDGSPELVRYVDPKTGAMLFKEEDRDYDGRIDARTRYEGGLVASIERDNNGDGRADEWQTYGRAGTMTSREVDRDYDGARDAFYEFEAGSLAVERHLGKTGKLERAVYYENRRLARAEEDLDRDGAVDTWTHFAAGGDREVVSRVEKDSAKRGKPDTFETYAQQGGKTVLTRREEDKNGDGAVDVVSIYENGKLKERQILDPELLPL